jgi:hypothetical protein
MSFVVQRFHPRIRPGLSLGSAGSKVAVHSQQGQWDSACALHCVAMALQISGFIADSSRIVRSRRRLEAALWRNAVPFFFSGTTLRELAALIAELDCGVRTSVIERGSHREVIPFIEGELARKRLVICSWRAVGESHCHAVLIAGAEGVQKAGRFEPHTFLILDPAEASPASMATCNARLNYANGASGQRRRYASYLTTGATLSVVINGAVSIDAGNAKKPT